MLVRPRESDPHQVTESLDHRNAFRGQVQLSPKQAFPLPGAASFQEADKGCGGRNSAASWEDGGLGQERG